MSEEDGYNDIDDPIHTYVGEKTNEDGKQTLKYYIGKNSHDIGELKKSIVLIKHRMYDSRDVVESKPSLFDALFYGGLIVYAGKQLWNMYQSMKEEST